MTLFLVLIVGFSLTASSVLAQARIDQRRGPGRGGQGGILMVLKAKQAELNLTDEQLEKITDLILAQEEKTLKHRNAQGELGLELRKVMLDRENMDYNRLKQILSQRSDTRENMFIERLKNRDAIAAVLTPEQQEALNSLRSDRLRRGQRFTRDRGIRRNPRLDRLYKDFEKT